MVAVIDYGVGNLFSLLSSLKAIGADAVITNDVETIKNADRIIVMEKGKIVEQGKHKELLSEPESLYSYLYQLQSD